MAIRDWYDYPVPRDGFFMPGGWRYDGPGGLSEKTLLYYASGNHSPFEEAADRRRRDAARAELARRASLEAP